MLPTYALYLEDSLGISPDYIGYIFSVSSVTYMGTGFLIGYLLKKKNYSLKLISIELLNTAYIISPI